MRLALLLNSFRREFVGPIPKHKGTVLRGKRRFVPPVNIGKKISLFKNLVYEEEVMKYLSKSYITKEQENEYLESKKCSHPAYWDDFTRRTIEEPLLHTYSADFLKKLDVSRSFEEEE